VSLNLAPLSDEKPLIDPLQYLPCSTISHHEKGKAIYREGQPSNSIYLVIEGNVKVSRVADNGRDVVLDIYQADEFFGESAFVGLTRVSERAVAIEATKLMTWTTEQIEEISTRNPKLMVAILQLVIHRSMEFASRIESFSVDHIGNRLVHALIRFSKRLGQEAEDGSVRMIAFTHELLSQYVGTSREVVTQYMNQFRRLGLLRYSRQGIFLNCAAMKRWLESPNQLKSMSKPMQSVQQVNDRRTVLAPEVSHRLSA